MAERSHHADGGEATGWCLTQFDVGFDWLEIDWPDYVDYTVCQKERG